MKPENWPQLKERERADYAVDLFRSPRGRYLMAQALSEAVKAMKTRPRPETSNIEDMEVLLEAHPIYAPLGFIFSAEHEAAVAQMTGDMEREARAKAGGKKK